MQRSRENPSLTEAIRARRLRPGPPSEADVPKQRPLLGRKVKPIKGQLDFEGNEIGADQLQEIADDDDDQP
jgi:hypothetical protein